MQVHLAGSANGELEPASAGLATGAGLCLLNGSVLAGPCGTSASNVMPPDVSGSGTRGDPYLLTTTYSVDVVDSKLQVTQTFQYVNGDSLFLATYAITNTGASQPVRVLVRGNLDHAGSPLGQGATTRARGPTSSGSTMRAAASEVYSPQRLRGRLPGGEHRQPPVDERVVPRRPDQHRRLLARRPLGGRAVRSVHDVRTSNVADVHRRRVLGVRRLRRPGPEPERDVIANGTDGDDHRDVAGPWSPGHGEVVRARRSS